MKAGSVSVLVTLVFSSNMSLCMMNTQADNLLNESETQEGIKRS